MKYYTLDNMPKNKEYTIVYSDRGYGRTYFFETIEAKHKEQKCDKRRLRNEVL